ncbi:MAG: fasciclin domain-containing protein, partial [Pseudomonadota bacterium]
LADADIAGALVGALGADLITNVLLYHVVPGSASLSELQEARLIDTALPGAQVVIDGAELIDADPQIQNPNFVLSLTDIEAANGEIQVIDRVLLPIDVEPVEDLKVIGTKMADVLQGGAGNDKAFGRAGSDVIEGGSGNDFLSGGLGSDLINGGAGDDRLRGGFGDDRLTAGAGNDLLVGGFGHDTFDFTDLAGSNKIRDFSSTDTLLLSAEDFATAGDVLETASELGRGILLETDDGSIFLRDVATLAESDILIV